MFVFLLVLVHIQQLRALGRKKNNNLALPVEIPHPTQLTGKEQIPLSGKAFSSQIPYSQGRGNN